MKTKPNTTEALKHTCIHDNVYKNTYAHNKHKTKAGCGHLLRPPARKWNETILEEVDK